MSIASSACTTSVADPAPRSAGDAIEVCGSGCDFTELAPALEAAIDGDTIRVATGTYAGGVLIDVSITLKGAGVSRTAIKGGGPVIQVGGFGAEVSPSVTIEDLEISGGVTRSTQEADEAGLPGAEASGGGVMIPAGHDGGLGATVTLRNVAILRNRVAPTDGEDFGDLVGSTASGGGIASSGDLTLEHVVVAGNRVGAATGLSLPGMTSDANGAGIMQHQGDLTITDSQIRGNVASATPPNGRFAEGGGLYIDSGTLTVADSVFADNRAELESAFPQDVEASAQPGGVLVHGGVTRATFERTRIVGNAATMTSRLADADANGGGIKVVPGVDLTIDASTIARNVVTAKATGGSQSDAVAAVGGGALVGSVTNTLFHGNTVTAMSEAGDASAAVGGVTILGTFVGGTISRNIVHADAPRGSVTAFGGGLWVAEEPVTMTGTEVLDNLVTGRGRTGTVRGGGIYDGPNPGSFGPSMLTLVDGRISGNRLRARPPIVFQGGGVFVEGARFRVDGTTIGGNVPDDCGGLCPSGR